MIESDQIKALLPHGDAMSLLDQVESWDDLSIRCVTKSHLRQDNPIVTQEHRHSSLLIEYAAQAAAIHAGLLNSDLGECRPAYVGAVKNIEIIESLIPNKDSALVVQAKAELLNSNGAIYGFIVESEKQSVISGKLVLVQP